MTETILSPLTSSLLNIKKRKSYFPNNNYEDLEENYCENNNNLFNDGLNRQNFSSYSSNKRVNSNTSAFNSGFDDFQSNFNLFKREQNIHYDTSVKENNDIGMKIDNNESIIPSDSFLSNMNVTKNSNYDNENEYERKNRLKTTHSNENNMIENNSNNEGNSSNNNNNNHNKSSSTSTPFSGIQFDKYYESQILSMKTQAELMKEKSDSKILLLENKINILNNSILTYEHDKQVILNENKILKKGITIQESRYRDLSQHNIQIEQILQQAMEYIRNLEEENRRLNNQHSSQSSFNGCIFPPQPPPDVF
eukprot:gene9468-12756_t